MTFLKKIWENIPALVKLVIASLLFWLFHLGWLPNGFNWPLRIFSIIFGIAGFLELLFDFKSFPVKKRIRIVASHPATFLVTLICACLLIKEAFPFSNFPMYANPSPTSKYYYLGEKTENGKTKPLRVLWLSKLTSAKLGKIYRKYRDRYAESKGKELHKLNEEDYQEIGAEVLQYVNKRTRKRRGEESATGNWQLVEVTIRAIADDKPRLEEETRVLATEEFGK